MNGTELRSFSHFQILTKIAYLSRNLQIDWFTVVYSCLKQGCPFGNAGILEGPVSKKNLKKLHLLNIKTTSIKY